MKIIRTFFVLGLVSCAVGCVGVLQLQGVEEVVTTPVDQDLVYQEVSCGDALLLGQGKHIALLRDVSAESARIVTGEQEIALARNIASFFAVGHDALTRMDCYGMAGKAVLGIINLNVAHAFIRTIPSLVCEEYVDQPILSSAIAGRIKVRTRACIGGTMSIRVRDIQGTTTAMGESRISLTADPNVWFTFTVPVDEGSTIYISCNPGENSVGACNWEIG